VSFDSHSHEEIPSKLSHFTPLSTMNERETLGSYKMADEVLSTAEKSESVSLHTALENDSKRSSLDSFHDDCYYQLNILNDKEATVFTSPKTEQISNRLVRPLSDITNNQHDEIIEPFEDEDTIQHSKQTTSFTKSIQKLNTLFRPSLKRGFDNENELPTKSSIAEKYNINMDDDYDEFNVHDLEANDFSQSTKYSSIDNSNDNKCAFDEQLKANENNEIITDHDNTNIHSIKQQIENAVNHGDWDQAASIMAQTLHVNESNNDDECQKVIDTMKSDEIKSNSNETSSLWNEISNNASEMEGANIAANWAISRSLTHLLEDAIASRNTNLSSSSLVQDGNLLEDVGDEEC